MAGGIIAAKRPKIVDTKEIVLCIGDSTSAGSNGGTGNGPTPPAGHSFYYHRSSNEIRALNPDVVPAPSGTQYPQAVIKYRDVVDKNLIIIPAGLGGSFISNSGNNWSTSGTLYGLAQTDVTNALSLSGKKLKAIYISLSINDIMNAVALQDIYDAWDSLLSRLNSDYPGIPICIDKVGVRADTMNARVLAVQNYIAGKASSDITVIEGMSAMDGLGYMADALHPTQTGNNYRGDLIGQWLLTLRY